MKNIMRKTKKFLAFFAAMCMVFMLTLPVMAEETDLTATEDPRESIMMMTLGYEDDNGVYTPYKAGTCFLINDEYVLTNKHVVTFTSAEFEQFKTDMGLPNLQPNDSHLKLYLYVNRDMKVGAKMHESVNSDDMDFAAVKLNEKIYDRKPIALGDSDLIETKDTVYAVGFPADSMSTKDYNTKDDVSIVEGSVSKITVTGSIDVIEHTAALTSGNSGGHFWMQMIVLSALTSSWQDRKIIRFRSTILKKVWIHSVSFISTEVKASHLKQRMNLKP